MQGKLSLGVGCLGSLGVNRKQSLENDICLAMAGGMEQGQQAAVVGNRRGVGVELEQLRDNHVAAYGTCGSVVEGVAACTNSIT